MIANSLLNIVSLLSTDFLVKSVRSAILQCPPYLNFYNSNDLNSRPELIHVFASLVTYSDCVA